MSRLPDLRQRTTDPELLDAGVPEPEVVRSLADLRLVNRWLGSRRGLLAAVRPHLSGGGRLLDVGCGSADLPAFLRSRLPGPIVAVGLDIKPLHLREAPRTVHRVVADVRALPFRDRSFDVVTASLFLHHFDAPEVSPLLARLYALARRALVVNDLRRALVPFLFGRVFFRVLFRSPVSVVDGLVSIRRGFRAEELRTAFARAGIEGLTIRRSFPYRLLAVAKPPHAELRVSLD